MHRTAESSIGTDSEWCHQRSFAAERQSAGRARGFVSSHLIEHRLLRLVDPVRLVVDSLAAAAVVHSRVPFTVPMTSTGDRVTVRIKDGNGQAVARLRPSPRHPFPTGGVYTAGCCLRSACRTRRLEVSLDLHRDMMCCFHGGRRIGGTTKQDPTAKRPAVKEPALFGPVATLCSGGGERRLPLDARGAHAVAWYTRSGVSACSAGWGRRWARRTSGLLVVDRCGSHRNSPAAHRPPRLGPRRTAAENASGAFLLVVERCCRITRSASSTRRTRRCSSELGGAVAPMPSKGCFPVLVRVTACDEAAAPAVWPRRQSRTTCYISAARRSMSRWRRSSVSSSSG